MSKAELSARIATEISASRAGANDAVTAVFSTIDGALASGATGRARRHRDLLNKVAVTTPGLQFPRTDERIAIATQRPRGPS